jgi:hypothetical protein
VRKRREENVSRVAQVNLTIADMRPRNLPRFSADWKEQAGKGRNRWEYDYLISLLFISSTYLDMFRYSLYHYIQLLCQIHPWMSLSPTAFL